MFDSKSPFVKAIGYIIISFFALIIIISFGMPDFMSRLGQNPNIIANVNGEKVHRLDFLRYRDSRFKNMKSQGMERYILNRFISEILLSQHAKDLNFDVSDQKIAKYVKEISFLQNPETKKYDPERLEMILKRNKMSLSEFYKLIKKDLISASFFQQLKWGLAVPPDDIKNENLCKNSKIQIKYAMISDIDLKKKFKEKLTVSKEEIDEEMKQIKKEDLKDPETDKKRITEKLKEKKLKELKKEIVKKIDNLADKKGSFYKAVSILKGKVGYSQVASIGEPLKIKKKEESLSDISNSKIFRETFLNLEKGKTSKVIESGKKLYIFTPALKKIKKGNISVEETASLIKEKENKILNSISQNLTTSLNEKAKIATFLKED